jgi:hypothetical protein
MNINTTSYLRGMDFDHTEQERLSFITQCIKGVDLNKYDFIHINEEEAGQLVNMLNEPSIAGYDLLTRPSLPQFTAVVNDEGNISHVVYISSFRHKKIKYHNGLRIINKPMVDAYIYQSCMEGVPDAVITICAIKFNKIDSNDYVEVTSHQVSFTNPASPIGIYINKQESFITAPVVKNEDDPPQPPDIIHWARDIKLLYLGIQQALTHRPTIFKERTESRVLNTSVKGKKARTQRKIKAYRVISIVPEELRKIPDSNRERRIFSCPSWGVIGHTRRLKNGKEIWVKPYVKGKERGTYSAKEYEIVNDSCINV